MTVKISELPAAGAAAGTDQLEANQSGTSRRLTVAQVATHVRSTATDTVVVAAGSAAAPSVAPTGDSNTGIFFPAADTIAFSEGGVEALRIDSSGNVGVGVASPASRLDVSGVIRDSKGDVRSIPQNSRTSAYTLVADDAGRHISITTGGVTVPASVFSIGDAVTIYNNSGSNQTITQGGSVTLRHAGTANTGNRTLAQYGVCTVLCVASNTFVISGAGLT